MKKNCMFITVVAFAAALAAVPAFAQVGVGVGLGSQTQVNVGGGAGVGLGAGVGTRADTVGTTSSAASALDLGGRIESNARLAEHVESMLPPGESINSAAAGFRNEAQFLSALHASQNLDIPLGDLRSSMTGSSAASLGSAIRAAKPEMNKNEAQQAAKKAEAQASATKEVKQ